MKILGQTLGVALTTVFIQFGLLFYLDLVLRH